MTDTRRNFLRVGGSTLATLSLAACVGDGGTGTETTGDGAANGGGTDGTETPTATGTDTPTATATETATPTAASAAEPRPATPLAGYADWHPAPSAIEFVEDGYAFMAMAPSALLDFADSLGEGALDGFEREMPTPGIDTLGDATTIQQFARSCIVYETDFDRSTAEREFEDLGFSEADTHRGFTVFTIGSDTRAGAVGDDAIVTVGRFASSDDTDKRPAVEAIVDAATRNADRYADVDEDCAALTSALGNAHILQGRTHEAGATFDGAVGEGVATHVESDDTRIRASVVFAEGAADESAVADWADGAEHYEGRDVALGTDSRVVDASALVPTGEVTSFPDDFPGPDVPSERTATVPQISFDMDYEATGDGRGLLAIRHEGGDAVAAEELSIRGSGFADVAEADQTRPGRWQGTASGDGNAVVAGDAVDVGVASDYEISVVYAAESGDVAATLAKHDGPGA